MLDCRRRFGICFGLSGLFVPLREFLFCIRACVCENVYMQRVFKFRKFKVFDRVACISSGCTDLKRLHVVVKLIPDALIFLLIRESVIDEMLLGNLWPRLIKEAKAVLLNLWIRHDRRFSKGQGAVITNHSRNMSSESRNFIPCSC